MAYWDHVPRQYRQYRQYNNSCCLVTDMLQGNNSLSENDINGCRVVIEVRTNEGGVKIQTIETTSHYHKHATRQQLTLWESDEWMWSGHWCKDEWGRPESKYRKLKRHHIIINMLQGNNSQAENHMNGCRVVIEVRTKEGGVKIQTIETTSHYNKHATRQQLTSWESHEWM